MKACCYFCTDTPNFSFSPRSQEFLLSIANHSVASVTNDRRIIKSIQAHLRRHRPHQFRPERQTFHGPSQACHNLPPIRHSRILPSRWTATARRRSIFTVRIPVNEPPSFHLLSRVLANFPIRVARRREERNPRPDQEGLQEGAQTFPALPSHSQRHVLTNSPYRSPSHTTPTRSPKNSAKSPKQNSRPQHKPMRSSAMKRSAPCTINLAWPPSTPPVAAVQAVPAVLT